MYQKPEGAQERWNAVIQKAVAIYGSPSHLWSALKSGPLPMIQKTTVCRWACGTGGTPPPYLMETVIAIIEKACLPAKRRPGRKPKILDAA